MYHPKIKGGLYLILNHLVTMALMGVILAYTMKENHMPNKIYLSFPRMKMLVDVSNVNVNTTLFGSPISLTIKGGTVSIKKRLYTSNKGVVNLVLTDPQEFLRQFLKKV